MKLNSFLFKSITLLLFLGVYSCSSESNSDDEVNIIVNTSNFSTSINENPSNGTVLGIVQGSTNHGSVSFSITEQNPSGAIAIDGSTGELSVANGLLFSFGTHPSITGTVKVANGSVYENATITITVNETIITVSTSDFSTSMDENPSQGQIIGTIEGSTNLGEVSFSISEQTPMNAMEIDPVTGELSVADVTVFDYETNTTITAIVKVENGAVFEESTVAIEINDVDEENIYYGDVTLLTQEEVDVFGANNYTEITGALYIGYYTVQDNVSITNLKALSSLNTIGDILYIAHNDGLENFEGLENINSIGSYLTIRENDILTDLSALSNINTVPNNLSISDNDSLLSLEGLNINNIGVDLWIESNISLINLDGLQNITSVSGSIQISDNTSLQNLDGLLNLNTVITGLYIYDNSSLQNLNGLSNMISIDFLTIGEVPLLINLEGLNDITTIGRLDIRNNENLMNLDELQNLTSLTKLVLEGNNSLNSLNGLSSLINISEELVIIDNPSISNLDGLSSLITVNDLSIILNSALDDFCGLENLINNDGIIGDYDVAANLYNPTQQDIINGNCSL